MNGQQVVVVIGTSTGGLSVLKQIVSELPIGFEAAVLVVMHVGSQQSILPQILAQYSRLPVRHPVDGEPLAAGTILVAPGDHHLLVEDGCVRLTRGPKENYSRPAIDPLFRSAAVAYRANVIGLVLTGKMDDGTVGLQAIKAYGGVAMVQDPAEAQVPGMPLSAIDHVDVDYCLPLQGLIATLVRLVREGMRREDAPTGWEVIRMENDLTLNARQGMEDLDKIGLRTVFTCPECHGTLWEIAGEPPHRFRCHTGHAFSASALREGQNREAEEAIWAAVRVLHEKRSLMQRFAERAQEENRPDAAAEHRAAAEQAAQHSEALQKIVTGR